MVAMALSLDLILELEIPMASGMVWIPFPGAFFHEKSTTTTTNFSQCTTKLSSSMVTTTCATLPYSIPEPILQPKP